MKFRQAIHKYLTDNGMFPEHADIVVSDVANAPENEPMKGRWDEDEQ